MRPASRRAGDLVLAVGLVMGYAPMEVAWRIAQRDTTGATPLHNAAWHLTGWSVPGDTVRSRRKTRSPPPRRPDSAGRRRARAPPEEASMRVEVKPELPRWACDRAGIELTALADRFPTSRSGSAASASRSRCCGTRRRGSCCRDMHMANEGTMIPAKPASPACLAARLRRVPGRRAR